MAPGSRGHRSREHTSRCRTARPSPAGTCTLPSLGDSWMREKKLDKLVKSQKKWNNKYKEVWSSVKCEVERSSKTWKLLIWNFWYVLMSKLINSLNNFQTTLVIKLDIFECFLINQDKMWCYLLLKFDIFCYFKSPMIAKWICLRRELLPSTDQHFFVVFPIFHGPNN